MSYMKYINYILLRFLNGSKIEMPELVKRFVWK